VRRPLIEEYPALVGLRVLTAPNPGLFTLTGTRVHLVGRRQVAIIDPGPDDPGHLDRLARLVEDADSVRILLTHHHADHAEGVQGLSARLGDLTRTEDPSAVIQGTPIMGAEVDSSIRFEEVQTDAGTLTVIPAPGHAEDHVIFHWAERSAVFVGDIVLGQGDTTWLGEYRDCVQDYLGSLDRIQGLGARYLLSAHGDLIDDPTTTIERFRAHRLGRVEEVRAARATYPDATVLELTRQIYGSLPPGLHRAAIQGVTAMIAFLDGPEAPLLE